MVILNNYEDIINLDRPISNRPKMSLYNRSSIFSPFFALTGYEEMIEEEGRITEEKKELTSEEMEILNYKLRKLRKGDRVTITYFMKDKNKNGGKYITINNIFKKIDSIEGIIYLLNNKINICDIININE